MWSYSVPDHLVGTTVIVQLYSEKVRVYDADHKKMAEHERSYSHGSWTFDINHYINTLMKKPGALKGSVALRQMPEKMQELFRVHFAENGKDFLKLLKYCRDNKYDYKTYWMHSKSKIIISRLRWQMAVLFLDRG